MIKSVNIIFSAITASSLLNNGISAFTCPPQLTTKISHTELYSQPNPTPTNSRRDLFIRTGATVATTFLTNILPANAANSPPTPEELNRIKVGYENIQYLLDNWDAETTVCKDNGGECKRDADAVRRYLGLRSTTDPLFQIDKVFAKVRFMDVDPDKLEDFFQATEDWDSTMSMSNSMAFISQFGEYNPGGGKDEVLKYLNESKTQVILAEKALKTILDTVNSASSS
mmetsp:Transcript_6740/g.13869  ORF Transcript_6740/g.13869 Transcript_6740/m.13869 type:complete len:227 (-) Transcript_6740:321-1001(-)|eukprot:CAMPEP_0171328938 /NCGR_PEP_ID=MMETSP0878-20121228/932_1 /TAXON_ID=67004 /ORGANISM="Thalassiosira weissflogii, Strain CCMP1336" /LENGTH=226 /DNA_ID=CAMNT_0011828825 /DNA_START=36 /DNA_END=716 /DNA_ORIENTATION=+